MYIERLTIPFGTSCVRRYAGLVRHAIAPTNGMLRTYTDRSGAHSRGRQPAALLRQLDRTGMQETLHADCFRGV